MHGIRESNLESGRIVQYPVISENETREWDSILSSLVKAARDNDSNALVQLGERYRLGKGAPKSSLRAYLWYQLAGQAGSKEAGIIAGELEKSMTKEQLDEAKHQLSILAQDLKKLAEYLKWGF